MADDQCPVKMYDIIFGYRSEHMCADTTIFLQHETSTYEI